MLDAAFPKSEKNLSRFLEIPVTGESALWRDLAQVAGLIAHCAAME